MGNLKGADPGFPVGGGTNTPGVTNMILPNFQKNFMKLRKSWSVGRGWRPLGSATARSRPGVAFLYIIGRDRSVGQCKHIMRAVCDMYWFKFENVPSSTAPTLRPPSCSATRALSCRLSASWACLTTAAYCPSSLITTTSRRTGRSEAAGSVPWRPTSPWFCTSARKVCSLPSLF